MIKIERLETFGFEAALRGMRNAKNSWHLQDSTMENGSINIVVLSLLKHILA